MKMGLHGDQDSLQAEFHQTPVGEGWVSKPDLDSGSTHLQIVFYV